MKEYCIDLIQDSTRLRFPYSSAYFHQGHKIGHYHLSIGEYSLLEKWDDLVCTRAFDKMRVYV